MRSRARIIKPKFRECNIADSYCNSFKKLPTRRRARFCRWCCPRSSSSVWCERTLSPETRVLPQDDTKTYALIARKSELSIKKANEIPNQRALAERESLRLMVRIEQLSKVSSLLRTVLTLPGFTCKNSIIFHGAPAKQKEMKKNPMKFIRVANRDGASPFLRNRDPERSKTLSTYEPSKSITKPFLKSAVLSPSGSTRGRTLINF